MDRRSPHGARASPFTPIIPFEAAEDDQSLQSDETLNVEESNPVQLEEDTQFKRAEDPHSPVHPVEQFVDVVFEKLMDVCGIDRES